MPKDLIRQVPQEEIDGELAEEWVRETDEPEVLNVGAQKWADGGWMVDIWAAEFIRDDDGERQLDRAVRHAVSTVPGVSGVFQEDREVWMVEREPLDGETLIRAVAGVADRFADYTRSILGK